MNWILALVAFAGLMTILSTVVTITVEALHKALSLRKNGLQEMLRAMHDNVVQELEEGRPGSRDITRNDGRSRNARAFADSMTRSPAFGGGGRWWWPTNWGLNLFQRRFERLTKRQFAEQLAHTDFGRRLADRDRNTIRRALAHTGYEFDRYGVAQSDFFRRRAKVISGLVAFAFVSLGNVNAIELYLHLATDEASLSRTMQFLDSQNLGDITAEAEAAEDRLVTRISELNQGINSLADTTSEEDAKQQLAALQEARNQVARSISQISGGTTLPMGRDFFPYCGDPIVNDERCTAISGDRIVLFDGPFALTPAMSRLVRAPGEAFIWILSLVATAGLLGLGAPFWYELFARTAAMTGAARVARAQGATPSASAAAATAVRNGKRGEEDPDIDELADAFLVSAGKVDIPYPISLPIGMRIGEASADAMGSSAPGTSGAPAGQDDGTRPPAGIRRAPGPIGGDPA